MKIYPSLEQVRGLKSKGNIVPIYCEVMADTETPVSAYLKVAREPLSFLLESVEGGERIARYSFIGTQPRFLITLHNGTAQIKDETFSQTIAFSDPLDLIAHYLDDCNLVEISGLPRFCGGAIGYIGYDAIRYFQNLALPSKDSQDTPEAAFMFVDTLLAFDHLKHKIKVISHVKLDGDIEASYKEAAGRIEDIVQRLKCDQPEPPKRVHASNPAPCQANLEQSEFEDMVVRAKEYIRAGDVIQVVLAQRLARPTTAAGFDIYRALRSINPAPYMYYLHLDGYEMVGASPEMLVSVEDSTVTTHPIAGTRRRGATPAEDDTMAEELYADEKERAEHIMLVDLGRNDVGRVSVPGSVEVPQMMGIEKYSHVMHMVSHVTGRLRLECTIYDALRSCFPAGTVSGAPKKRAMEIISELEPDRRGAYAGAVGYIDYSGNIDTAICIRTIIVKNGVAYVEAGAGIVADSIPENEYHETLNKARALMQAIDEAEGLE